MSCTGLTMLKVTFQRIIRILTGITNLPNGRRELDRPAQIAEAICCSALPDYPIKRQHQDNSTVEHYGGGQS